MSELSEATAAVTALVANYGLTRDELADLLAGPADGGPGGNGLYPVTNAAGATALAPSPQRLAADNAAGGKRAFDQSARLPAVFDDFDRADGPLHGTACSTGQVWQVSGPGGAVARTVDGAMYGDDAAADSNFYASLQYGRQITFQSGVVRFERRGNAPGEVTTRGPQVVLIAQSAAATLTNMLHLQIDRTSCAMELRKDAGGFDPVPGSFGSYDMLPGTDYAVGLAVDKTAGRCRIFVSGPGVSFDSGWLADSRIGQLDLTCATWQIQSYNPATDAWKPSWRSVQVGPPKRSAAPRFAGLRSGEASAPRLGSAPGLVRMPRFVAETNGYWRVFETTTLNGYVQAGRLHLHAVALTGVLRATFSVVNQQGSTPVLAPIDVQAAGVPITKLRASNGGGNAVVDLFFPNAADYPVTVDCWFEGAATISNFGVAKPEAAALETVAELAITAAPFVEASGQTDGAGWYSVASASTAHSGWVLEDTFEIVVTRNDFAQGERIVVGVYGVAGYRVSVPDVLFSPGENVIGQVRVSHEGYTVAAGVGRVRLDVYVNPDVPCTLVVRKLGSNGRSIPGPVEAAPDVLPGGSAATTASTRVTGFAPIGGTASKEALATYHAPAISATPTQGEVQALADALQAATRRLKAIDDALRAGKLPA